MSYAAAASKNRLPPDQQPHPDPNLLEGDHHDPADVDLSHSTATEEKVHVVPREEFERDSHPVDEDSIPEPPKLTADDAPAAVNDASRRANSAANKAADNVDRASREASNAASSAADATSDAAKDAKRTASNEAKKLEKSAQDTKETVKKEASKGAAAAEEKLDKAAKAARDEYDVLSEKAQAAYNKMSKEAREDWHKLSKESKKRWEQAKNSEAGQELQKPEVWGSLLGVANLAVIGFVTYSAVTNWKKPHWDKRVVSATVIGLGAWFGVQGWLIPQTDAVKQRRT